jgi:cell division protein FtsQ
MGDDGSSSEGRSGDLIVLPGVRLPRDGAWLPSGRSLLAAFALLALAGLLYLAARETSMFAVRSIQVAGASPAVAERVRAALAPLRGSSLVALDRSEVERRLAALPDVASANYDRAFPHTLRIVVQPERAVAVLRRGSEAWLVSTNARVLSSVPLGTRMRLARIWLPAGAEVEVGTTLADDDGVRAVHALAAAKQAGLTGRVEFARATLDELTLVLHSGLELRLGNDSMLGLKLAVARRILPQVLAPDTRDGYVDLRLPQRPVAGPANSQLSG